MRHSAFRIPPSALRSAVTLIEMLVAIAVSLIVMFAVITIFDQLNDGMNRSKATIEQAGELRNVSQRLRQDLDGLTASTLPWTSPDAGDGCIEYIEGTGTDSTDVLTAGRTFWGDRDDVLMFTSRSKGRPFVGRFVTGVVTGVIESELAEIIWWTRNLGDVNGNGQVDPQEMVLHRRVLLIRPDLNDSAGKIQAGVDTAAFFQSNDISVHSDGTNLVANTLADLTLRQNRAFHTVGTGPGGFPHALNTAALLPIASSNEAFGTDVVLDKIVAFDVRVYDPLAPIRTDAAGTTVVAPGDSGWAAATTQVGRGAYVDLNYAALNSISYYSGPPNAKSLLTTPTYSTWPLAYEQDGVNQDVASEGASPLTDEGRDGFDSNSPANGAIDDPSEYETSPPYPHPITIGGVVQKIPGLRGVQVRIRIMENDSRSVRQATVASNFVPE